MADWKEFLTNIYFNIKQPGAFSGSKKLQSILLENGFSVSLEKIRRWTQDQDAYSLFKPLRYRFKRNRIVTTGLDYLWDADLADMSNIQEHNEGYSFLLIAIDVFSRHLWIQPTKSKSQNDVFEAFSSIFQSTQRRPARLRTDKGKEFVNRKVQGYLKRQGIKAFTTKNETKANYAERVIRTIKTLLYRYFLKYQTYKYIDVLQDLVHNYNNRPHHALGKLSPSKVTTTNEAIVWKRMYIDNVPKSKKKPFMLKVGDKVRISHLKYTFQRDYQQKWTEEYFVITQRLKRNNNLYRIKDLADEHIDGWFYESELQKINKDENSTFRIEKIIRRKGSQIYVKWMGWPSKFNSWVSSNEVENY